MAANGLVTINFTSKKPEVTITSKKPEVTFS